MKFNSIKFKIVLLYTAVLGVILIIYSSILYLSLHYTLYSEVEEDLRRKAQEIGKTISSYLDAMEGDEDSFSFAVKRAVGLKGQHPNQSKIGELERRWLQVVDKLGLKQDYLNFANTQGRSIASSSNLRKEQILHLFLKNIKKAREEDFRNMKFKNRNLRVINVPFAYRGNKGYIQVGTSLNPTIYILQNRLHAITISIPIILLLASFVGWFLATRILKPVGDIAKTASEITHEDLSIRIKAERLDEEMKYLAEAFNDMIERLEKSFKYIAEFSSHVAHELKTPLAIIRGETEIALKKERSLEEYQRVIKVNLEETERMIKTTDDLLLLAKLDYRPEVFKFEEFDLIPFFEEIYEQSRILASEKNITVDMDLPHDSININGDRLHLRRLFFNLIHNAIKFNKINGGIVMAVKSEDKNVIVSVSDTGVGIAKEDLPKVFDRFFHKETFPQEGEPGSGLGLSIAQSIAKVHHGKIEVESHPRKGSTFTVRLPLS